MITPFIKRLWVHLAPRRKKQIVLLIVIMVVTSLSEIGSIGAVLPFLGALMSPETIFSNPYVKPIVKSLEITDPNQLVLPMTLLFVAAALFNGGMRLLLLWAQTRLGYAIGSDISVQMYERTLYQPYSLHVSRNSSQVISGVSTKVNHVINQIVNPLLQAASSFVILLAILSGLFVIDPEVAVFTFAGFGLTYAVIMALFRKRLTQNSKRISRESNQVVKYLQEGLGGIRDVLIDGTQAVYCKTYRLADLHLRRAQANNQIIGASPRFVIEALGIAIIAVLAYELNFLEGGFAVAIPMLGAFAIGAQRLLPVLQQLYSSWSSIRGGGASFNDVLDLLEQPLPGYVAAIKCKPIKLKNCIKLSSVSFRYTEQSPWVLRDINLEIPKGSRIGLMGSTGSGKSTLIDILMALLVPAKGSLIIDETPITEQNIRNWQTQVSHVPQSIFLADASIAENIAFGVPLGEIDYYQVQKAAQRAQISETIESWENGYDTYVGERGVRLSGGQRQRIGIARALYKQAGVIIFDEATSALDNETEAAVMDSINAIGNEITVLIVAHRLSTLKSCDKIYMLEAGQVKLQDAFSKIIS